MNRKAYNREHKAEKNAHQREYYLTQVARFYGYSDKRRALLANALMEDLPVDYRDMVVNFYGRTCMYPECTEITKLEIDHIVPITKGGSHTLDNFQVLCKYHNGSKGNRNSIDYRPVGRRLVCMN